MVAAFAEKPVERPPVEIGAIVASKYRVDRVLGVGGMGVVVAATHVDLEEPRALKFMLPKVSSNPDSVARFFREARATAKLKSAHVAHIFDIGRLEDGLPFIVMEYLEGADLKSVLEGSVRLPVTEAVDYTMQALAGLAEAHSVGIVHRDLKPANLFVTTGTDGLPLVKIVDFGVSKLLGSGLGPSTEVTQASAVIGSPHYMSPEQLASARMVDARTDLWSIGVMLYEMLTGRLPFDGPSLTAVTIDVVQTEPDNPSDLRPGVPPALDSVVMKCLAKKPEARYRDAATVATDLAPFGTERSRGLAEQIRRIHDSAVAAGRTSIPEIAELDWEKVLAADAEDAAPPATPGPVAELLAEDAPRPDAADGATTGEREIARPPEPEPDQAAEGAAAQPAERHDEVAVRDPSLLADAGPAPGEVTGEPLYPSQPDAGSAAAEIGVPEEVAPRGRRWSKAELGLAAGSAAVAVVILLFATWSSLGPSAASEDGPPPAPSVEVGADAAVALDPAMADGASAVPPDAALDAGQPVADAAAPDAGARPTGRRPPRGRLPDIYNDTYVPSSKPPRRKKP